jgi:hypothetical protein
MKKSPKPTKKPAKKSAPRKPKLRVLEVEIPHTLTKEQLAEATKIFESHILAATGAPRLVMGDKMRAPRRQAARSKR